MTEDELIMAVSTLHRDLNDQHKTVSKSEAMIADFDRQIARQELIYNTSKEALGHLVKGSVILMVEFRSLQSGLRSSRARLGTLKDERHKAIVVRNKALAAIPDLQRRILQLELQLDTYEPPRTVLEFRRRDK